MSVLLCVDGVSICVADVVDVYMYVDVAVLIVVVVGMSDGAVVAVVCIVCMYMSCH